MNYVVWSSYIHQNFAKIRNCFKLLTHYQYSQFFKGPCVNVKSGTFQDNQNYNVRQCFFEEFNNRAINSTGYSKFLIKDSTFFSVSNPSGNGGAVLTTNGEIVHNRICSFNCSTTNSGQYCYSQSSSGSFKNYMIESTLSRSSEIQIGDAPFCFDQGNQHLTQTNISNFRTNSICGFISNFGNIKQSDYNSITNNKAQTYCIRTVFGSDLKLFRYNVINNTVTDRVISNFKCNQLTIEECNIINNTGTHIIITESYGHTEVLNCYFKNGETDLSDFDADEYTDNEIANNLNLLSEDQCQGKPISASAILAGICAFRLIPLYFMLFLSKDIFAANKSDKQGANPNFS